MRSFAETWLLYSSLSSTPTSNMDKFSEKIEVTCESGAWMDSISFVIFLIDGASVNKEGGGYMSKGPVLDHYINYDQYSAVDERRGYSDRSTMG